jgi:hypothetical protein
VGQAADELRDAEDIKQEIERTREDMAATLDAIGDKVSPKLQAERQMERLRQRGIDPQRVAMATGALLLTGLLFVFRQRRARAHR